MTHTAVVAISRPGSELARALLPHLHGGATLFLDRRFALEGEHCTVFDLPAGPLVRRLFASHQRLVLFMPVGAAIRLLAPELQHKHRDPAVVCVDDAGQFAVSLLSGHVGGADDLALQVAGALGGTPVVTSASHATGKLAIDLLGRDFGWKLEADPVTITRASAAMINDEPVGLYQGTGETGWLPVANPLPTNLTVHPTLEALASSGCAAALLVSDSSTIAAEYSALDPETPVVVYRPPSLVAGMGCRRGASLEELEGLLKGAFEQNGLSLQCLSCIATAEIKKDEPSLLELARTMGVSLRCFSIDELNAVFEDTPEELPVPAGLAQQRERGFPATPSNTPRRLAGVWGVAEPASLLASGSTRLLVAKQKSASATIAVARRVYA